MTPPGSPFDPPSPAPGTGRPVDPFGPQPTPPIDLFATERGWRAPVAGPAPRRLWLAVLLFLLTGLTTTTMGAVWILYTSAQATTELPLFLLPETVRQVWSDPALLSLGLQFSLPAMFILLCHEMGHYLACRRYRLPATLPYFLPLPLGIGTLGAFIRIRTPIRTKRELFDVGVAGPIAGFVALIPFLVLGVLWSDKISAAEIPPGVQGVLLVPGHSLALGGLARLIHGPLGDQQVLQLHPFALAAWFGLLATSLNLIPLGQLDGGHILYAALGRTQRTIAPLLWACLVAVAFLVWPGWGLWCVVTLVMGLRHPPVYDEAVQLDPVRRRIAWAALVIFLLSFMPLPIDQVLIQPASPIQPAGPNDAIPTVQAAAPAPPAYPTT